MKIAVLGAPGSGKSDFAYELSRHLVDLKEGPWFVVDDYVSDLRDNTLLEYGHFGNHIDDLQVVFKRRERELHYPDGHTITCGTVLDSTAHCFVRSEDKADSVREMTLQQERLRTIASTFGLLYTDTWDYDYAFWLPYEGNFSHDHLIDQALRELIFSYAVPVMSFRTGVDNGEKASSAAQAILSFEEKQLPEIAQLGVRSGSEDGEDDGDSSESVPDVPEQRGTSDDS